MGRYRSLLVSAIAMAILPVYGAYAADATDRPQTEATGGPQQPQAALPPADAPAAIAVKTRSTGLKLNLGAVTEPRRLEELRDVPPAPAPLPRAEELQLGSATSAAGAFAAGTGLKLSPSASVTRPGWEVSGRVGPLRFLSPLDGEGEAKLRLGGRVPGQPRMPGMGLFNVGIHYNFE